MVKIMNCVRCSFATLDQYSLGCIAVYVQVLCTRQHLAQGFVDDMWLRCRLWVDIVQREHTHAAWAEPAPEHSNKQAWDVKPYFRRKLSLRA